MQYRKKQGMTLIEILISIALLGLFLLVVTSLIISAVRNTERSKISREQKSMMTQALSSITADVGKGYILPTIGTTSVWVPSAILLPNPYGDTGTATGDLGNGEARDRIIITVPSVGLDQMNLINPVPNLRYVEYVIPSTQRNTLFRRTYNITPMPSGYNGFNVTGGKWMADDSYFTPGNVLESAIVAELPGNSDVIEMTIQRPQLPSMEHSFQTNYDRYLVNIKIKMTSYFRGDPNAPIVYEEETAAKVTSK